jgi:ribosomal protein S18 acetylase RimI-like enzyme
VIIRELRGVDGEALRALWSQVGFRGLGDDDLGLARLARRNPGLVLVAAQGSRIVGSALGAWDGRRGWIYHVATVPSHRRQGIATRLIDRVEAGLAALGCPKVNVMVRDDSDGGAEFWRDRGYEAGTAAQYGKELRDR